MGRFLVAAVVVFSSPHPLQLSGLRAAAFFAKGQPVHTAGDHPNSLAFHQFRHHHTGTMGHAIALGPPHLGKLEFSSEFVYVLLRENKSVG